MEHLRKIRREKGLTQEQLAAQVGVKRSLISKYESGNISPSLSQLEKIAAVLGVSVSELLTGSPENQVRKGYTDGGPEEEDMFYTLAGNFSLLTEAGQKKALDYIKDLAGNEAYRRPDYIVITKKEDQ